MSRMPMLAATLAAALALLGATRGLPFDWSRFADTQTIDVLTTDDDGGSRITTIWIVVVDGQAYIRTAATTWGDNVERNGSLRLRDNGIDRALRAEKVFSQAEKDRVIAAFHDKYGTMDTVMGWIRFGEIRIFRLIAE